MPSEGLIATIDASPHARGAAYFALARYKLGDDAPYAYKTADYGRTWTRITSGLRDAEPVRTVREDPIRRGLLLAGTETGMYVSFDDGGRWQSLQLNLPRVPVTDIQIRRDGDVVVSTEGRAFWVLDDIAPLREMSPNVATAVPYLFKPSDAYRLEWGSPPIPAGVGGRNKPSGALIRYVLPHAADSTQEVKLEILDGNGTVLRGYSSKPRADAPPAGPGRPPVAFTPHQKGDEHFFVGATHGCAPSCRGRLAAGESAGVSRCTGDLHGASDSLRRGTDAVVPRRPGSA